MTVEWHYVHDDDTGEEVYAVGVWDGSEAHMLPDTPPGQIIIRDLRSGALDECSPHEARQFRDALTAAITKAEGAARVPAEGIVRGAEFDYTGEARALVHDERGQVANTIPCTLDNERFRVTDIVGDDVYVQQLGRGLDPDGLPSHVVSAAQLEAADEEWR